MAAAFSHCSNHPPKRHRIAVREMGESWGLFVLGVDAQWCSADAPVADLDLVPTATELIPLTKH
jgi:hypothetical protein